MLLLKPQILHQIFKESWNSQEVDLQVVYHLVQIADKLEAPRWELGSMDMGATRQYKSFL